MRASAVVVALMLAACGPTTPSQYCRNVWAAEKTAKEWQATTLDELLLAQRLERQGDECRRHPGMVRL